MKFQTWKGGFLFWINLWNFHILHEEVPTTSLEQEVQLDDVIERIERLSINDEAPPGDQPGPSRKIPKWDTKTLESVHPDEVGKTGTRSSKSMKMEE